MEWILFVVVGILAYFMVIEGLNLVGAVKESAKLAAKGIAEVPNATKWARREITIANKEHEKLKQTLPDEYKRTFKETYREARKESNVRYKPVFEDQDKREAELDAILAAK